MKRKFISILLTLALVLTLGLVTALPVAAAQDANVGLTAEVPVTPVIGIEVAPTDVSFPNIVLDTPTAGDFPVTVTNTGTEAVNVSASVTPIAGPDVYTTGLTIAGDLVADWGAALTVPGNTGPLDLALTVPSGTTAGTATATLVFWAVAQ